MKGISILEVGSFSPLYSEPHATHCAIPNQSPDCTATLPSWPGWLHVVKCSQPAM